MNLKNIYIVCTNDVYELPVATFDNYKKLAGFLNVPLGTARCLFCRGLSNILLSDKENRYRYRKVIIDEDDEEKNVKYSVNGLYGKTGVFFGEYSDYKTAIACCNKLVKKGCYQVIIRDIETNKVVYEVFKHGLHRRIE